jgi:hypothetical protein
MGVARMNPETKSRLAPDTPNPSKRITTLNAEPPNGPVLSSTLRPRAGALIINADDWGREKETTDRTLDCFLRGSLSSVSAMVFMEDSERAATQARELGIDAGLHLNFTTRFSASGCSPRLVEHQQRLCRYLRQNRLAQIVFHPGLAGSFRYVVAAQLEEFQRLYGVEPDRIDGHHHMHLCANISLAGLIPAGTLVRRNFSFAPGEKSWINRYYRKLVDRRLKRRHHLVDFLFSLAPVEPRDRLQRIFDLARHSVVELETHPVRSEEYRFLTSGEIFQQFHGLEVSPGFATSLRPRPISSPTGP